MAQIKMDVSEYETLKENKKLLEDSLEEQKKLHLEIDKLNQEKIDILKKSSMSVTKTIRQEKKTTLLEKKDSYKCIEKIIDKLCTIDSFGDIRIDYYCLRKMPKDYLQNLLYREEEIIDFPHEEITTHGLDEIKNEIRQDLENNLDKETKDKLLKLDQISKDYSETLKQVENLKKENLFLKNLEEKLDENKEKISKIYSIVSKGYGFRGKAKMLDKIISVVNEHE